MASSLKAAIENKFGISAELVEGHNGIYEVIVNGKVGYTNQSTCASGFPSNKEIFQVIGRYRDPLPDIAIMANINGEEIEAPFCSLSDPAPKIEFQPTTGCGCSTDAVEPTPAASGCGCGPSIALLTVSDESTSTSCCG